MLRQQTLELLVDGRPAQVSEAMTAGARFIGPSSVRKRRSKLMLASTPVGCTLPKIW